MEFWRIILNRLMPAIDCERLNTDVKNDNFEGDLSRVWADIPLLLWEESNLSRAPRILSSGYDQR